MSEGHRPYNFESYERLPEDAVEVMYENERVQLPFDVRKLALFLEPKGGGTKLGVRREHHRSAEIPEHLVVGLAPSPYAFKQKKELFFTVDLKGTGYVFPEGYVSKKERYQGAVGDPEVVLKRPAVEMAWGYDVLGLMDERLFDEAVKDANLLQHQGARTEAIAAGLRLKKIYYKSELRSVQDLQKEGVLPDDPEWRPVLMVRLLKCKSRIRDVVEAAPDVQRAEFEDAFRVLNHEAKIEKRDVQYDTSDPESVKDYLVKFAEWNAQNLAVLHNNGMAHHYLNGHNITLAGEMVDLDSATRVVVESWLEGTHLPQGEAHQAWDKEYKIPRVILRDVRDMIYAFRSFLSSIVHTMELPAEVRQEVAGAFQMTYEAALRDDPDVAKLGFPTSRLKDVVRRLLDTMIVRDQRVAPVGSDKQMEEEIARLKRG